MTTDYSLVLDTDIERQFICTSELSLDKELADMTKFYYQIHGLSKGPISKTTFLKV